MTWIILIVVLLTLIGATEKSNNRAAQWVRRGRVYQGARHRVVGAGRALWGRSPEQRGRRRSTDVYAPLPTEVPRRERRTAVAYDPPATPPPAAAATAPSGRAGVTVDFFQGILALVNAAYEGPTDALRQVRSLTEGGRQWNNGLIRLHQRMSDPGDMRIDPFVSDHVVRAAAFGQAMVLELTEADTAMTALLNMTLAEITERGLQVPNTR